MIAQPDLFQAEPTLDRLKPQTVRVYRYMQEHGSITKREAATDLGCWNLPARILEIRALFGDGHVVTRMEPNAGVGSHGRYVLAEHAKNWRQP